MFWVVCGGGDGEGLVVGGCGVCGFVCGCGLFVD